VRRSQVGATGVSAYGYGVNAIGQRKGVAPDSDSPAPDTTLFLTGDVMTGRGIDQILAHPGNSGLFERYVQSALDYVRMAEEVNGAIPRPVNADYLWGDALPLLEEETPDLRLINLETAITARGTPEPKGINYRMHPANTQCLVALRVDGAVLANNHVLDWGADGLDDTLDALQQAGIAAAGAGRDTEAARQDAHWPLPGSRKLRLFAWAHDSSGVPDEWAAGPDVAGINWLPDLSAARVAGVAEQIRGVRQDGDLVVVSLHWGSNWGHEIPAAQTSFAHALIDEAGVDLVWGHSSHHPRAMEVYHDRLILYGCGDFLNDYEGIKGHDAYRPELVLLYLVRLAADGRLRQLRLWPLRLCRFQLQRASVAEGRWLADSLSRAGQAYGTQLEPQADGSLLLCRESRTGVI
jgi:poly-gamma-glutamate capsule biosynthesis protein CapA/YwtB (metallophosphatase superfamily)